MALGDLMAGASFHCAGLGACHGIAHAVGIRYNIPHGVINAILLPHVMQFNLEVAMNKFVDISYAFGVDISGMSMDEAAVAAINAVRQLSQDIGLPQKLSEVGVKREDIPFMAENAMLDFVHATNPRTCSEEDMRQLYKKAY